MADVCIMWPYVNDEPSKLYLEIYEYTGKNRKLTNLIYATSSLSWYREQFSSSDFSSQGELNSSVVIKDLKVDEYLNIEELIRNTENTLDAKNSKGDYVLYATVAEIIDKVLKVNENPESKVIAKIIPKNGKYIISVLQKDDTNYFLYEQYKSGQLQLQEIIDKLRLAGFTVSGLSSNAQVALNSLNASNFPLILSKLQYYNRAVYLSENLVELMLLLMRGNTKVERLYQKFGKDTVKVLKHVLSGKTEFPEELQHLESKLTKETLSLIENFRKDVVNKALKVNVSSLISTLENITRENKIQRNLDLQRTLNSLYKDWHLDKDTIYASYKEITSLKEATSLIISRLYNNMQFLKSKGHITVEEQKDFTLKLEKIQKRIEGKEYLDSILLFLEEVTSELESLLAKDMGIIDKDSFNEASFQILYAMLIIRNYSPIIDSLVDFENLEDALDLEVSDINKVKKLASKIQELLRYIEKGRTLETGEKTPSLADRMFTVVYKYLKEKWGEDKKQFSQQDREVLGNFEVSLELALKHGTDISLNFLERMLFNLTEVSDPVLATFGKAIKDLHEVRDDRMKGIMLDVRRATDKLYKSGSSSDFMYTTTSNGEVHIISEIDYDAYNKAKAEFRQQMKAKGYKGELLKKKMAWWEELNTEEYTVPGLTLIPEISGEEGKQPVKMIAPIAKYRKELPTMTTAQRDYYNTMMSIKASLEYNLQKHGTNVSLFSPVQITSEVSEQLATSSPSEAFKLLKDNLIDKFSIREDDTAYGNLEVLVNADKEELKLLPTYYIRKLNDLKRVSRDFSKSILAYAAMATNYSVMIEHINSLELVKEFLMERTIELSSGGRKLINTMNIGNTRLVTPVVKKTRETATGDWLTGIMDTKVYGIRHKKSGNIGSTTISTDKLIDAAVSYTSVTGLAANIPGAIANALVGKLQMIIEAGGKEFFSFKSYMKGSGEYWALLPEFLGEINSNNKKSKLYLLMQEFDVLDDFYDKIRETGFYKNGLNKIIGNTSLFFLYGLGEHLLHGLGMLACLYHTKVIDTKTGKKVPLIEIFDREIEDNNGKLIIKEGYTDLNGKPIDAEFIKKQKNAISYVNRSMHGAFGSDEKGLIHQYAWGRLIMNFRQWMPAHYARRFNKLHWDATLGDYREGYYYTFWKFVAECAKDIKRGKFQLATRYKNLDDMLKANLRRVLTECILLMLLSYLASLGFGDDPKHRSKTAAWTKYEIRRLLMETSASNPFSILQQGDFVTNIYKTLNSPIAAISPALKFTTLFGILDLITGERLKSGPHEGELVYVRNVLRVIPFYDLVNKYLHIDTDDSMFKIFNKGF